MGLMGGASAVIELIVDYVSGSVKTLNKDWQKERMAINPTRLCEMWTNFLSLEIIKFYVRQKLSQLTISGMTVNLVPGVASLNLKAMLT